MVNQQNTFMIIGGMVYEIDQTKRTISSFKGNSPLIHEKEMIRSNDCYVVGLDTETMELTPISKSSLQGNNVIRIAMPRQVFGDVNFPKDEERKHFNNLSKHYEWGVTFLSKDLVNRIHGKLPVIDVAGVRYDLDVERQLLKTTSKNHPNVSMENMEFLPDSGSLVFIYNREKRCAIEANDRAAYSPDETFYVELEDPASIDPVGMAKRLGLNEGAFILPHFNYRPLHHAKVTSLDRILANQFNDQFLEGINSNNPTISSKSFHNAPDSFGPSLKR